MRWRLVSTAGRRNGLGFVDPGSVRSAPDPRIAPAVAKAAMIRRRRVYPSEVRGILASSLSALRPLRPRRSRSSPRPRPQPVRVIYAKAKTSAPHATQVVLECSGAADLGRAPVGGRSADQAVWSRHQGRQGFRSHQSRGRSPCHRSYVQSYITTSGRHGATPDARTAVNQRHRDRRACSQPRRTP